MPDDLSTSRPATAADALTRLMEGNRRWVDGRLAHPNRSTERREDLANAQRPFATVFSCIDSRVPPEIIFDCGIGDLVVIRTGAHVLDDAVVMGSLQFAAAQLKTPLVLVLGHQACGAVAAAVDALENGRTTEGSLDPITTALRPAYEADSSDMVRAHTRLTVNAISEDPVIANLISGAGLSIVGGHYSLDDGEVTILE